MFNYTDYCKSIFSISSQKEFEDLALEAFNFQFKNNKVYSKYCKFLNVIPSEITDISNIPFLPIEFFKSHQILSSQEEIKQVFDSSGTTGTIPSKHFITDLNIYESSFLKSFLLFYGKPQDYAIIGLLPSYLERNGSSLVYMVNKLIELSKQKESGFYLNDYENLIKTITQLESEKKPYLLFGVSFALLDIAEKYNIEIKHGIIVETGGMKGRRKELTRKELHQEFTKSFNTKSIHSEYGMTELLSQAYSHENEIFNCPPWMKILIRSTDDPLQVNTSGKGAINIIDLANINSCCFIATSDLGQSFDNSSFKISGRFDDSDIRGCNLLVY